MPTRLPHDPGVVSCPESVNSPSLLAKQSSHRSLQQNSSVSQISSYNTKQHWLHNSSICNVFDFFACCVCFHLYDNEKLADENRSLCRGVSLLRAGTCVFVGRVRIVSKSRPDLCLSGNERDSVWSKHNDRSEQEGLGGDKKQWSGGDLKLAEVRKRLSSLFICLCERGFTVWQRGLASPPRWNENLLQ